MLKVLFIFLFLSSTQKSHATSVSCFDLFSKEQDPTRQTNTVWLPMSIFDLYKMVDSTADMQSFYLNPNTGEKLHLPKGWISSEMGAILNDTQWTIVFTGRKNNTKANYINLKTGTFLFSSEHPERTMLDNAYPFNGGHALVVSNERYYFTNESGRLIAIPQEVQWVSTTITKGLAAATYLKGSHYEALFVTVHGELKRIQLPEEFVDRGLQVTSTFGFTDVGLSLFKIGNSPSYDPNERFGYVDTEMKIAIAPVFEKAQSFIGGFAWVKKDGLWGKINSQGEWSMAPRFEGEHPPADGVNSDFILVNIPQKGWTVFDQTGRFLYDLPSENARHTQSANLIITDNAVELRYDEHGNRFFDLAQRKWLGDFNYHSVTGFVGGYAAVVVHGESQPGTPFVSFGEGFINRYGELVLFIKRFNSGVGLRFPPAVFEINEKPDWDLLP